MNGPLVVAVVLALSSQTPAPAPPPAAAPRVAASANRAARLELLKTELGTRRAALTDLDNKKRSLVTSLGELDESLARLADEADAARTHLNQLRTEQATLRAKTGLDEDELRAARVRLETRLRAMYMGGEGGTARALLGAEGFEELALRRRLLRTLSESDAKLVDDVARAEDRVTAQRARLREAAAEAEVTSAQLDEQKQLILATREERQAALTRIGQERALTERAERELDGERADLAKLIDKLADDARRAAEEERKRNAPSAPVLPPVHHGKGILAKKLPWPVEGLVIRKYGVVVEKETRAEMISNGIEIRADDGAPIAAVADGRVVHVGWLRGFGRVVLINHGDGHHTLSAHLSRASVVTGDSVRRGQTIGFVGDTESTNGPKLYFELRENGRPKDPSPYLR